MVPLGLAAETLLPLLLLMLLTEVRPWPEAAADAWRPRFGCC